MLAKIVAPKFAHRIVCIYCTTQRYCPGPTRRSLRSNFLRRKVGTVRILPDAAPIAISSLPLVAGDHLSAKTHGRGASGIQPGESEMCLLAEETEDLKSEHQKAHVGPGGDHPSFAFSSQGSETQFHGSKGVPQGWSAIGRPTKKLPANHIAGATPPPPNSNRMGTLGLALGFPLSSPLILAARRASGYLNFSWPCRRHTR